MPWGKPLAKIRQSFRAKIFTLLTLVIVVHAVIYTASYVVHERNLHFDKLSLEGNLLASLLANNIKIPLFAENIPMLDEAVDGILKYRQVISVAILRNDGSVILQRVRPGEEAAGRSWNREGFANVAASPSVNSNYESIEFISPVLTGIVGEPLEEPFPVDRVSGNSDKLLGHVRVVIDAREMNKQVNAIIAASILTTGIFIVVASFATYFAARSMTGPLQHLWKGVTLLQAGDMNARIRVDSEDEVGKVADAFNKMVEALDRREKENRQLAEELRNAQEIRAKEEWTRTFDAVPDLISILDRKQRLIKVNRSFASRFGRTQESMSGKTYADVFGLPVADEIVSRLEKGLKTEIEHWSEHLECYFWITITPVHDGNDELLGSIHVARDISEWKQAEQEKKLVQAKLIQTNRMTSLGLLVSGMAHEVNNPNMNIKLAAHILTKVWNDISPILKGYHREHGDFTLGGLPYSEIRENIPDYLAGITESSRRIEGIIKNLREFVRRGKANLTSQVDMNMVVTVSVAILNHQIKKLTDNFHLELSEDLPPVRGNTQLLEQVLINLIMNGIQSLPDRKAAVYISTKAEPEGSVLITVRDEGCGMTPEVKTRLFEPFFSTKLEKGGTGLGLAISNVIIAEHSGRLEFESLPGQGTIATIRLPALEPPAQEAMVAKGERDG